MRTATEGRRLHACARVQAKNGEADRTPEDILAMVKAQAAPAHRLILFLQQSSVEWASSLWLNVVQEVDPTFQRTVRPPTHTHASSLLLTQEQPAAVALQRHTAQRSRCLAPPPCATSQVFVASKFDNRLKEFAERWEVDKYLAATGYLPTNVRPFFVALPKVRLATTGVLRGPLLPMPSACLHAAPADGGLVHVHTCRAAGAQHHEQRRVAAPDQRGGRRRVQAPARERQGRL